MSKPKKTLKTINEGEVGCFLCDDGLWYQFCSPENEADVGFDAPQTPVRKVMVAPAKYQKTPGHMR